MPLDVVAAISEAAKLATKEALRARNKYSAFASRHEGFAVLKEEVDELWDEVKRNDYLSCYDEAVQVAAMALRFISEFPPQTIQDEAEAAQ